MRRNTRQEAAAGGGRAVPAVPEAAAAGGARPRGSASSFGATRTLVSLVGQGTWQMERAPAASVQALRRGIDLGATHVDTAEIYGAGEVERLVGAAIRGCRERVFLASKVDPARATRQGVRQACEQSLNRLGTDYLDLYLLHWLAQHPLEETVAGFEDLVAAGKIRWWGVSNFDEVKLAELLAITGPDRIACNQVMHHLQQRSIEHAVVPFCHRNGIAVVGYSPFGAGRFPPGGRAARAALEAAAASLDATIRQVTLAFLLHTSRGFVIPKASRLEHVEENAAAARLQLPAQMIDRLDAAFPLQPHTGGVHTW